jgi:hypothetical protein
MKMEEGVKGREKYEEEAEGRGDPKPSHLFEGRKKIFFIFIFESCSFLCVLTKCLREDFKKMSNNEQF